MVNVQIDVRDVGGEPTAAHVHTRDSVTVWAPTFRPSNIGDYTVAPSPRKHYFDDSGKVLLKGIEEGPLVVQFDVRQLSGKDTFNVNVPAGDDTVSLRNLLAADYELTPPVISDARKLLDSTRRLQESIDDKAASFAKQAKGYKTLTTKTMERLNTRASAIGKELDAKKKTLSDGLGKEAAEASEEFQTDVSKVLAETRVEINSWAADLESDMRKLAKSAKGHADRAGRIADSTSWRGDVLTVNGKSSPPLTGPKGDAGPTGPKGATGSAGPAGPRGPKGPAGDKGDTGPVGPQGPRGTTGPRGAAGPTGPKGEDGKDGATTWGALGGKPSTFPPKDHKHASADISDAVIYFGSSGYGNRVVKTRNDGHLHDGINPSQDNHLARKGYVDKVAFSPEIKLIKGGIDLDDFTKTGVYHQSLDRDAKKSKNHPSGRAGLLEVFNPDAGMVYQRFTDYGNKNNVWTRGLYSKSWSRWIKSSQDGHKHTAGDIADATSSVRPDAIVQRWSSSQISVPSVPNSDTHAASKSYVDSVGDKKADKNHAHRSADISDAVNYFGYGSAADRLVKTDSDGKIKLGGTPTGPTDVVNKKYVDSRVQLVSSLPSSPESDVLYVIAE